MRILIADDEAMIRLGLRVMLEEMGHQVVGAAVDGAAAVRLANSSQPDLVILDIKMPGMDGLAAARQIAVERPVPVIMLTAYSERELVERAASLAVQAYLVKPVREADLAPAIEIAVSRFREWNTLREQAFSLQEAMLARELVDRAKRVLMEREGLAEEQAFLHIQHRSRYQRRSMGDVAREILDAFEKS